jgi:histidine triad (HIT) family protein
MSTVFEKIITREIPADIIYEDELVLAFLDIHPIRKGHALVVPKQASTNLLDTDSATWTHMAHIAKRIAHALTKITGAPGINIHMNNGYEAGQDVPHAHLHVIPRFVRDEAFTNTTHESFAGGESQALAAEIRTALTI